MLKLIYASHMWKVIKYNMQSSRPATLNLFFYLSHLQHFVLLRDQKVKIL